MDHELPCGSWHFWLGDAIYGRLYHVAPVFLAFVKIREFRGLIIFL